MDEEYKQRVASIREQYSAPTDAQRAARTLISTFLQVDTEAAALRTKVKAPPYRQPIVSEEEEDFAIAMNLYENFQAEKRQILPSPAIPKKEIAEYDPRINIEERHQLVNQRREERKTKQETVPKSEFSYKSDSKFQELRAKRAALEAEIQPEVLEEQRLLVKQEREEQQALDLKRKMQEKQVKDVETVDQHRERMAREKAKEEEEMRILGRNNLVRVLQNKIEHYAIQAKHFAYRRLARNWAESKAKEIRIAAKMRFRALHKEFRVWAGNARENRAKKIAEEEKIAEEAENMRLEDAYRHYKARRLWICWKEWLSVTVESKRTKENEREAEKRRKKIAQLFDQMQQRRPVSPPQMPIFPTFDTYNVPQSEVSYPSQSSPVPAITKETSEQSVGPETSLESSSVQTDLEMRVSVPSFNAISAPVEVAVVEPLQALPSPAPSPATVVKKQKVSKQVTAMQQREEERRIKREQLEQKYREKEERERLKKLEAEQKALEEDIRRKKESAEKRRLEQQRKKEIEAKKREDAARCEYFAAQAEAYRLQSLKKYAILQPWKQAVERAWKLEQLCIAKGEWVSRRLGFRLLVLAVERSKEEKIEEERRKEALADAAYNRNLALFLLKTLQIGLEMEKTDQAGYAQRHSSYILTQSFRLWHTITPQIQTDNDLRRAREAATIRSFTLVRNRQRLLGPSLLQSWREGVMEAKDERFKKQHEAEMWSKVQQWLGEDSHLDASD